MGPQLRGLGNHRPFGYFQRQLSYLLCSGLSIIDLIWKVVLWYCVGVISEAGISQAL